MPLKLIPACQSDLLPGAITHAYAIYKQLSRSEVRPQQRVSVYSSPLSADIITIIIKLELDPKHDKAVFLKETHNPPGFILGTGGGIVTGSADIGYEFFGIISGTGGAIVSGNSDVKSGHWHYLLGTGGAIVSGSAAVVTGNYWYIASSGGAVLGGSASVAPGFWQYLAGSGGAVMTGSATVLSGFWGFVVGAGGAITSGSATLNFGLWSIISSSGGGIATGSALASPGWWTYLAGSGGGVLAGSATIGLDSFHYVTGSGGGIGTGSATVTTSFLGDIIGSGGAVVSGSAAIGQTLLQYVAGSGGALMAGSAAVSAGLVGYVVGSGGAVAAGSATIGSSFWRYLAGSGGGVVAGSAPVSKGAWGYVVGSGGAVTAGSASIGTTLWAYLTGSGGGVVAGSAAVNAGLWGFVVGSGGAVASGSASAASALWRYLAGSGGGVVAGSAAVSAGLWGYVVSSGGAVASGSASVASALWTYLAGSGGGVVSGSAPTNYKFFQYIVGAGGAVAAGSASLQVALWGAVVGTGGAIMSGSAGLVSALWTYLVGGGGAVTAGSATVTITVASYVVGSGGAVVSGSAPVVIALWSYRVGTGGALMAGSAVIVPSFLISIAGTGGGVVAGSGTVRAATYGFVTGSGGAVTAGSGKISSLWSNVISDLIYFDSDFMLNTASTVEGGTFYALALATSGLPVSFAVSLYLGSCSVKTPYAYTYSGQSYSLAEIYSESGVLTITTSQAGNSTYVKADNRVQSVTVVKNPQSFINWTWGSEWATGGGTRYLYLEISPDNGLLAGVTSSNPNLITLGNVYLTWFNGKHVSALAVTCTTPGSYSLNFSQPGNALYSAAPTGWLNFSVPKYDQSITDFIVCDDAHVVLTAPYVNYPSGIINVHAGASSYLLLSYAANISRGTISSASSSFDSYFGAGYSKYHASLAVFGGSVVTVVASQAGNATYNAAPDKTLTFTIPFKTDSVLATLFVDSNLVTVTDLYEGMQLWFYVRVTSAALVHLLHSTDNANWSDIPTEATTPAASSYLTANVYSRSSGMITLVAGYHYYYLWTQTGDQYSSLATYYNFTVKAKTVQSISAIIIHDGNHVVLTSPYVTQATAGGFYISAKASSGLPVSFTVATSNGTISVNTSWADSYFGAGYYTSLVSLTVNAGAVTGITAHQAGNSYYLAAPDYTLSFTMPFKTDNVLEQFFADGGQVVVTSLQSGQTLYFFVRLESGSLCRLSVSVNGGAYTEISSALATVSGASYTKSAGILLVAGSLSLKFWTAAGTTYAAYAGTTAKTVAVAKIAQSFVAATWGTTWPKGGGTCTLYMEINPDNSLLAQVTSSNASLITLGTVSATTYNAKHVSMVTVTCTTPGSYTLTLNQAGNTTYSAAPAYPVNFTVPKIDQTISDLIVCTDAYALLTSPYIDYPSGVINVHAGATSALLLSFATSISRGANSPTTSFDSHFGAGYTKYHASLTVYGGTVVTIVASQAGNANYNAAPDKSLTFTIPFKTDSLLGWLFVDAAMTYVSDLYEGMQLWFYLRLTSGVLAHVMEIIGSSGTDIPTELTTPAATANLSANVHTRTAGMVTMVAGDHHFYVYTADGDQYSRLNADYYFTVKAKLAQTLSAIIIHDGNHVVLTPPYVLAATPGGFYISAGSDSGLLVSFTGATTDGTISNVTSWVDTFFGTGYCTSLVSINAKVGSVTTITAHQAGNSYYLPATDTTLSFTMTLTTDSVVAQFYVDGSQTVQAVYYASQTIYFHVQLKSGLLCKIATSVNGGAFVEITSTLVTSGGISYTQSAAIVLVTGTLSLKFWTATGAVYSAYAGTKDITVKFGYLTWGTSTSDVVGKISDAIVNRSILVMNMADKPHAYTDSSKTTTLAGAFSFNPVTVFQSVVGTVILLTANFTATTGGFTASITANLTFVAVPTPFLVWGDANGYLNNDYLNWDVVVAYLSPAPVAYTNSAKTTLVTGTWTTFSPTSIRANIASVMEVFATFTASGWVTTTIKALIRLNITPTTRLLTGMPTALLPVGQYTLIGGMRLTGVTDYTSVKGVNGITITLGAGVAGTYQINGNQFSNLYVMQYGAIAGSTTWIRVQAPAIKPFLAYDKTFLYYVPKLKPVATVSIWNGSSGNATYIPGTYWYLISNNESASGYYFTITVTLNSGAHVHFDPESPPATVVKSTTEPPLLAAYIRFSAVAGSVFRIYLTAPETTSYYAYSGYLTIDDKGAAVTDTVADPADPLVPQAWHYLAQYGCGWIENTDFMYPTAQGLFAFAPGGFAVTYGNTIITFGYIYLSGSNPSGGHGTVDAYAVLASRYTAQYVWDHFFARVQACVLAWNAVTWHEENLHIISIQEYY